MELNFLPRYVADRKTRLRFIAQARFYMVPPCLRGMEVFC